MRLRTGQFLPLDLIAFVGLLTTSIPWQTRFLALYFAARLFWTTTHGTGVGPEAGDGAPDP